MDLAVCGRVTKQVRAAKQKTMGDHSFGTMTLNKSMKECAFGTLMQKLQLHFTYLPRRPFLRRARLTCCVLVLVSAAPLVPCFSFSLLLACTLRCLSEFFCVWFPFPHRMVCLFPHPLYR